MGISKNLKIINDPIYGFISVPNDIIYKLIEHPVFQRLRRISQMGLSYLVYPGAQHTRFHHALGAMHLMQRAVTVLRSKGTEIDEHEETALYIGILLHDIGHGPFSHGLEGVLITECNHEGLSLLIMEHLNEVFEGQLTLAIEIFKNNYHKQFLHQLISGQLDMDRLDFLRRDSFYTGVAEGSISSLRLITMLQVIDDKVVVEEKGIYSVEKFLVARRLMYWQVYLHKTSLVAEQLLMKIMLRARDLAKHGVDLKVSENLFFFLNRASKSHIEDDELQIFLALDDVDVLSALKSWLSHKDIVLRSLSQMILNRDLLKIKIEPQPFAPEKIAVLSAKVQERHNLSAHEASYFVFTGSVSNLAYHGSKDTIELLKKNGKLIEVAEASDQLNIQALSQKVVKYFLCYPKTAH